MVLSKVYGVYLHISFTLSLSLTLSFPPSLSHHFLPSLSTSPSISPSPIHFILPSLPFPLLLPIPSFPLLLTLSLPLPFHISGTSPNLPHIDLLRRASRKPYKTPFHGRGNFRSPFYFPSFRMISRWELTSRAA